MLNMTRVASSSDCSLGRAASQAGTGYEPTVVVRILGLVVFIGNRLAAGRARLSSARRAANSYVCGALHNIGENLVFLRRFSGDTEQIAQTDDKGGRVSRSVWSAWSLPALSDV